MSSDPSSTIGIRGGNAKQINRYQRKDSSVFINKQYCVMLDIFNHICNQCEYFSRLGKDVLRVFNREEGTYLFSHIIIYFNHKTRNQKISRVYAIVEQVQLLINHPCNGAPVALSR